MKTTPSRREEAAGAVHIELSELVTPLGRVVLGVREEGLCALDFAEERVHERLRRSYPAASFGAGRGSAPVLDRLRAYFAGELGALDDIAVAVIGTAFQRRVWAALRDIAPGSTVSYAELAERVGRPSAARAVGAANGRNPVALAVPCHRVIASDGTLGGYAGGLAKKAWLLAHEGASCAVSRR